MRLCCVTEVRSAGCPYVRVLSCRTQTLEPERRVMLTVNIRERDGGERRLVFGTEEVTVGRAKGSDILLPRNNISKRHARFVDRDDKVVLVDLRSTNGTYVNGRRITAPEVIGPKDKIYIGDFVMKVESVKSPQHEHTMPQSPVSETAMMDPAPLDERGEDAQAAEAPTAAEELEAPEASSAPEAPEPVETPEALEIDDQAESMSADSGALEIPSEEVVAGPSTDPGQAASEVAAEPEEPSITPEDIFNDEVEEATAALDLEELGISPDEAEEVALAPTQHRGIEEEDQGSEDSGAGDDEATEAIAVASAPEEAPEAGDDDGAADDDIAFEEFEIDLEGDDDYEPLDPSDDPPTRQAPAPAPVVEADAAPDTAPATTPEPTPVTTPEPPPVTREDAPPLTHEAIDAMLGDVTVDGIQINSPRSVAVRRGHAVTMTPGAFESQEVLQALAESLAKRAGFDELPGHILEGSLPDGIALQIIPTSVAPEGPIVTLNRATEISVSTSDLVDNGTLTDPIKEALEEAIKARKNVVVVSARAEGRSTMLSALAHLIPADASVAMVSDTSEVALPQANAMRLNKGALRHAGESLLDVVPGLDTDRVLIDPLSAEDVVEFIGLALGGNDGMLVTFQGRTANAVLRRMSLAVELAVGAALGERARDMVAEAVDLIVVIDHADDGIVVREVITVEDSGPSGFRTSEILAYS